MDVYNKSKRYIGILSDVKSSPCSFLLYTDGDIREEIGGLQLAVILVDFDHLNTLGKLAEFTVKNTTVFN